VVVIGARGVLMHEKRGLTTSLRLGQ
jgi:hypothetical protein